MPTLTTQNGFLTFNGKTYDQCDPHEKILFNEAIKEQQQEDEHLMQMLKRATLPLLEKFREYKSEIHYIKPWFV